MCLATENLTKIGVKPSEVTRLHCEIVPVDDDPLATGAYNWPRTGRHGYKRTAFLRDLLSAASRRSRVPARCLAQRLAAHGLADENS